MGDEIIRYDFNCHAISNIFNNNMKKQTAKEIDNTIRKPIMIEFNGSTSDKDIYDLKILLEDISKKYNFRWFVHTYYEEKT